MRRARNEFLYRLAPAVLVLILSASSLHAAAPKYVFFFIGDGMAGPQIHAAEAFLASQGQGETKPAQATAPAKLNMRKLDTVGMCTTFANNRFITGSAAAATAMACGVKGDIGVVSMAADKKTPLTTIAEAAHAAGMAVGIVSSVSLDHATPACFYAHNESRGNYHEISMQLARSPFEYFAGGGMKGRTHAGADAKAEAVSNGFLFADTLDALDKTAVDKRVLATNAHLAGSAALCYELDRRWLAEHGATDAERNQTTLADFTMQGARLLMDDPDGFFMMVEGGKIDWACHANDAMAAIMDTLAFDEAVKMAMYFAELRPDETLIVVTGDHECGGMTLGFAGTRYASAFEVLAGQKVSHELFAGKMLAGYLADYEAKHPDRRRAWRADAYDMDEPIKAMIAEAFGLDYDKLRPHERAKLEAAYDRTMDTSVTDDETTLAELGVLYGRYNNNGQWGGYDPLTVSCTHVLNNKAGVAWTSYSHTALPTPVFAGGAGAEAFNGYYDNTDLARKLAKVMGLNLGE